jgi:YD repeat-containing protein
MLFSLVALLVACGGDTPKDTSPADTADTGVTDDTANTDTSNTDTADTSGSDTADTADTADTSGGDTGEVEPLPACDTLTPYRGCTAVAGYDTPGAYVFESVWDADGRNARTDAYTDASRTVLVSSVTYTYTDGLLTRLEYRDAAGEVSDTVTYTYDAAGHLATEVSTYAATEYTRDDEGRILTSAHYSYTGSVTNCTRTWTSTATSDDYEETCVARTNTNIYRGSQDSRGLETFRGHYGTDGTTLQSSTTRVWRMDCQIESQDDGAMRQAWTYDANNRLIGSTLEWVSGAPGSVSTYTYTCPS